MNKIENEAKEQNAKPTSGRYPYNVKFKDYIPSKEKNDQISEKVMNSEEMIELRSRSFLLLKNIIESRLEDEIREHNLDARTYRPQMTFDPANPEFSKGYLLGYQDGKFTILKYFAGYLNYLNKDIVPLFNELYEKYWNEMHEQEDQ